MELLKNAGHQLLRVTKAAGIRSGVIARNSIGGSGMSEQNGADDVCEMMACVLHLANRQTKTPCNGGSHE